MTRRPPSGGAGGATGSAVRRAFPVILALAASACGGESGDAGSSPPEASPEPVAGDGFTPDSLLLVANLDEAPLHLLPVDWPDLFHFRFADEVLTLEPRSSPEVRRFMAGVIEAEARRAGTVEAGYDWLRRLDTSVLAYEAEADDVRWRLRQGHAWLALLPSAEAGPLLEREGFRVVPLESGTDPDRWYRDSGSDAGGPPVASVGAEAGEAGPEDGSILPDDWLSVWAAEVRGRG